MPVLPTRFQQPCRFVPHGMTSAHPIPLIRIHLWATTSARIHTAWVRTAESEPRAQLDEENGNQPSPQATQEAVLC